MKFEIELNAGDERFHSLVEFLNLNKIDYSHPAVLQQHIVSGVLPLHEYVECMNKHMAEMYMRHDYRSMYEIWEKVSELAKLETTRL